MWQGRISTYQCHQVTGKPKVRLGKIFENLNLKTETKTRKKISPDPPRQP